MLRTVITQPVKWTVEGAVKGLPFYRSDMDSRVFCDVRAYVSCREYVGILQSASTAGRFCPGVVNQGGTAGDR